MPTERRVSLPVEVVERARGVLMQRRNQHYDMMVLVLPGCDAWEHAREQRSAVEHLITTLDAALAAPDSEGQGEPFERVNEDTFKVTVPGTACDYHIVRGGGGCTLHSGCGIIVHGDVYLRTAQIARAVALALLACVGEGAGESDDVILQRIKDRQFDEDYS